MTLVCCLTQREGTLACLWCCHRLFSNMQSTVSRQGTKLCVNLFEPVHPIKPMHLSMSMNQEQQPLCVSAGLVSATQLLLDAKMQCNDIQFLVW